MCITLRVQHGLTTTFAGIAMNHVPAFVAAQIIDALIAAIVAAILFPAITEPVSDGLARRRAIAPGE